MARTGEGKRAEGVTAFIVERGTPGFIIEREIPMIGGRRTYELVFEDCRVPARQVLGELGKGYAPMQLRLNVRRLADGRALRRHRAAGAGDDARAYAKQRVTFGVPLADRQAIQWWIADAATRIHACRLMVAYAAAHAGRRAGRAGRGQMIKVFATEMAQDVVDHAMQAFGAMGMTKELPLAADGAAGAGDAGLRGPERGASHGDRAAGAEGARLVRSAFRAYQHGVQRSRQ